MTAAPTPYHDLRLQQPTGDQAPEGALRDPILESENDIVANAILIELNHDLLNVVAESNGRLPDNIRSRIVEISGQLHDTLTTIDTGVSSVIKLREEAYRTQYPHWAGKALRDADVTMRKYNLVPGTIAGAKPTQELPASKRDVLDPSVDDGVRDLIKKLTGKTAEEFLATESVELSTIASNRFDELRNYIDSWNYKEYVFGAEGVAANGSRVALRATLNAKMTQILQACKELPKGGRHSSERAEQEAELQKLIGKPGEKLIQDKHIQFAVDSLLREHGVPASKKDLDAYAQKYIDSYQQEVSERRGRAVVIRRALESRLGNAKGSFNGFRKYVRLENLDEVVFGRDHDLSNGEDSGEAAIDYVERGRQLEDYLRRVAGYSEDRIQQLQQEEIPADVPTEEQIIRHALRRAAQERAERAARGELSLAERGRRLEADLRQHAGYTDKMLDALRDRPLAASESDQQREMVLALRAAAKERGEYGGHVKGDDTTEHNFAAFFERMDDEAAGRGNGSEHRRHSGRGGRRAGQHGGVPPQREPSEPSGQQPRTHA
jgi:hypothetical protein